MAFTDFVCLLLGGGARPDGQRPDGEAGQLRAAREHKKAVGRRECAGPQPFGQNTSLNPNSAQLSLSGRPNHT